MMLGTDVSALSTSAATAAGQGLSIVVPLYNEAAGLALLHARLNALATALRQRYGLASEVVYVDDGSADATLAIARGLVADALDVQVVSLSRNFGKEAALMAGLDHARRGAVLFMDGDGQHPPDLVEKLVGHWIDGGYDVVYTAKAHRDYEPAARAHGVTTFSPGRLVGLSIEGLTSFSVAPLRFASLLGVALASVAFLFGLSILWETWVDGKSVPGYPSLVVGLMTIGGVQLIMIGIVGEYIGKILSELKARPIYFVAEHSVKHVEAEASTSASERTAAE